MTALKQMRAPASTRRRAPASAARASRAGSPSAAAKTLAWTCAQAQVSTPAHLNHTLHPEIMPERLLITFGAHL